MPVNKTVSWDVAKTKPHDASGLSNPEEWDWEKVHGINYPVPKKGV
jgi:hypothetical protein